MQFSTVDDNLVEGDEVMTFRAVARDSLDVFSDSGDMFPLTVYDDDSECIKWSSWCYEKEAL